MEKVVNLMAFDVTTLLNAYQEANGCTRAEMARGIGLPERRLRGFMRENRKPSDFEEFTIRAWFDQQGFDYIPPKTVIPKDSAASKTKSAKRAIKETDAIGIKGDAKVLVRTYKEWKGYKTDTDAATELVKKGFMSLLKEAENA